MALTGMTGLWPYALGNLADPAQSALRIVLASGGNSFQSINLITAQSASGAGVNVISAGANGGGYGAGYWYMETSGNNASAQFQGSHNGANWMLILATAASAGTTATGQWSGYYPFIRGTLAFASAGTGGNSPSAMVNLNLSLL